MQRKTTESFRLLVQNSLLSFRIAQNYEISATIDSTDKPLVEYIHPWIYPNILSQDIISHQFEIVAYPSWQPLISRIYRIILIDH